MRRQCVPGTIFPLHVKKKIPGDEASDNIYSVPWEGGFVRTQQTTPGEAEKECSESRSNNYAIPSFSRNMTVDTTHRC